MSNNVFLRYKKIFFSILFLSLIFPELTFASIIINEVSPSSDPEWVKLYNDGDVEVDLAGYLLEDGNSIKTDDLTLSGIISSKGYLTFNHDKGWLNDSGDTLKLYNNATPSALIAEYSYPTPSPVPDPTQSATSTPTPTKSPSPVPTLVPTVKPTPTKTASSRPSPTEESISILENQGIEIDKEVNNVTDTSESEVLGLTTEKKKSPILSIIFVILGISCLGYVGYLLYNGKYKNAKDQTSNT